MFQLPRALSEICTIKEGQTPNVDVLKPTIDWSGDADFGGLTDNFIVHAIANLTVPTAGSYTFYTKSDDGSALSIDGVLLVSNDFSQGERSGAVTLTAGAHAIEIRYFEGGGGEFLQVQVSGPERRP